jgi:hypothetical protein
MNLKGAIHMNLLRNNTVTTKDVDLAKHIFGPDIGTVNKGQTTRRKPLPITKEHIKIPEKIDIHP